MTEKDDPTWLKLGDLFASMPDNVLYSIDLKAASKETAKLVFAIVKAFGVENRIAWGSSLQETHDYLLELGPEIARYYPAYAVTTTFVWHLFGCLFLRKLEHDVLMPPVMTSEEVHRQRWLKQDRENSWLSYALVVYLYKLLQTFGVWMYPQLRRRGNSVILWTPNEQTEFSKIKNTWRVDGVMTDRPSKLREWVEDYQMIEQGFGYGGHNELTIITL